MKRWLSRCISRDASTEDLHGADQKRHFEALERLADYVQQLPDDDGRFVRIADAGFQADGDTPTACLGSRLSSFGPGLYFGNDPDAWLTEYSRAEMSAVKRYRHNRGTSS